MNDRTPHLPLVLLLLCCGFIIWTIIETTRHQYALLEALICTPNQPSP